MSQTGVTKPLFDLDLSSKDRFHGGDPVWTRVASTLFERLGGSYDEQVEAFRCFAAMCRVVGTKPHEELPVSEWEESTCASTKRVPFRVLLPKGEHVAAIGKEAVLIYSEKTGKFEEVRVC